MYKKTNPRAEIDSNKRDQFWTKSEQEESQRRARETEERKRAQTEAEKRIKEREVQEAQKRDKITEDRYRKMQEQKYIHYCYCSLYYTSITSVTSTSQVHSLLLL